MAREDDKIERDLQRLIIDFEHSVHLAEWEFVDVVFPGDPVGKLTTIRHKILSPGKLTVVPVHWRLEAAPPIGPALYTILGEQVQYDGYIKVRATVAGQATVLIGLRRDG